MSKPDQPERTREEVYWRRVQRRRERIRGEIARNRAGGHRVPTWVLAAILGVVVLGWVLLVWAV